MRYRRSHIRRRTLTPKQLAAREAMDVCSMWVDVIAEGLAVHFRRIDSQQDLHHLEHLIDNHLRPALKASEEADTAYTTAISSRSRGPRVTAPSKPNPRPRTPSIAAKVVPGKKAMVQ